MTERNYERTGLLAIDPMAFGVLFAEPPSRETVDVGGVPVLTIRGPLEHHAGMWCDNYDSILSRASEAIASAAPGLVLRIDSPGGLVSGCMETARAIRALADASGKKLVALADGHMCSAAYALACVAHSIVTPPSSTIGSIGVLAARPDVSESIAASGARVFLVKSGARKGDGDPRVPVSEDELAALQESVDTLSEMFFAHVAMYRPMAADDARNLQAATLHGERAVTAGLADVLGGIDEAVALARGETQQAAPAVTEDAMASNLEEGLAKLRKAAEGDDEEAKKARRMLAAMDEEEKDDGGDAESEEDDKEAKSASSSAAESDAPPPKDDDKPEPKKDDEDAKALAARALATAEATARKTLLASRPDISDELRATLSDTSLPLEHVEKVLAATPRASRSKAPPQPATPTQGSHEHDTRDLAAINARLGLPEDPSGVVRLGNKTQYHAMTPAEARADRARRAGGSR